MVHQERVYFSVHIEQTDTEQVAHLAASLLDPEDSYQYIPGLRVGTGIPATLCTYTERYRRKVGGGRGIWYSYPDGETIFEVCNQKGTDNYKIEFRELEQETAEMIRREFQSAFPPGVEPVQNHMQRFGTLDGN